MTDPKPSDPGSPAPPPPPAAPTYPTLELTSDDKTMAMLSHVGTAILGWLAPLIIYLMKKDQSKFVAFHALQSLFFQLIMIVVHMVVATPTCGLGVLVTWPLAVIYAVIIGLKANKGEWAEYAGVAGWARNSVFGKS